MLLFVLSTPVGARRLAVLLLSVVSLTCSPSLARAADEASPREAATKVAAAMYEGFAARRCPRLHIYLKPIPGSQVVTTMVAYKVGSADENWTRRASRTTWST